MDYNKSYFKGKTVAVTGGASGIGLALCEELLESGAAKVVLADFNKDNLELHEKRLSERYPGKVKGILCDVTKKDQVCGMVESAAKFGGGRLDLLINCAGAALGGRFTDSPLKCGLANGSKVLSNDDWRKGFAINFMGPLWGCEAAIPLMIKQGGGQIVNIISGIAFAPMAFQSSYAATKAALNALTLALRTEYWDCGIKFNSATPGTTATAIFSSSDAPAPPEAQTPHQSARKILNGVALNHRLILGDESDAEGAKYNQLPDLVGTHLLDPAFLGFARQRSQGTLSLSFTPGADDKTRLTPEQRKQYDRLGALGDMGPASVERRDAAFREYFESRDAFAFDHDYYKGKTAIVTGAASGVGQALCEELLSLGAEKVVLADVNEKRLLELVPKLDERYRGRVRGIACNVTSEESVKNMIHQAQTSFSGHFDILINCAGVGQMGQFTETPDSAAITARTKIPLQTPEEWDRVFAINFYGPLYGCRAALPLMLAQGKGQIANIISGVAMAPMPYQSIYASSKAALNALTLVLRYEYWDAGIIFNSATPGTVATAIFGEGGIPVGAQPPEQAARRILAGMANNQRLIMGDDDDFMGAVMCFNEGFQPRMDKLCLDIARARRSGKVNDYGDKDSEI